MIKWIVHGLINRPLLILQLWVSYKWRELTHNSVFKMVAVFIYRGSISHG